MTTMRQRRVLKDYADRNAKLRRNDHRGLISDYMRGLVVVSIAMLAAWLLWQISDGIVARLL